MSTLLSDSRHELSSCKKMIPTELAGNSYGVQVDEN